MKNREKIIGLIAIDMGQLVGNIFAAVDGCTGSAALG